MGYPYVPPQVASPKECRKIFLTQLPPTGILGVPKNLKLLAVPLFELYDNAHRYGPVIASLPQLLARVKFVFCDENAQPMTNPHIDAYQLTNISIYNSKQMKIKQEKLQTNDVKNEMNIDQIPQTQVQVPSQHQAQIQQQLTPQVQPQQPQPNANGNTKLSVNPLMNYRA